MSQKLSHFPNPSITRHLSITNSHLIITNSIVPSGGGPSKTEYQKLHRHTSSSQYHIITRSHLNATNSTVTQESSHSPHPSITSHLSITNSHLNITNSLLISGGGPSKTRHPKLHRHTSSSQYHVITRSHLNVTNSPVTQELSHSPNPSITSHLSITNSIVTSGGGPSKTEALYTEITTLRKEKRALHAQLADLQMQYDEMTAQVALSLSFSLYLFPVSFFLCCSRSLSTRNLPICKCNTMK